MHCSRRQTVAKIADFYLKGWALFWWYDDFVELIHLKHSIRFPNVANNGKYLNVLHGLFWGQHLLRKRPDETIGPIGFTFGQYVIGALALFPLAIYEARKINLLRNLKQDKRLCSEALGLGVFMFGGIELQQTLFCTRMLPMQLF